MIGVSWARVHLLSTYVGKNHFRVTFVNFNEPPHLRKGCCDSLVVCVVKNKALTIDLRTGVTISCIREQFGRIVIASPMKEKGTDDIYVTLVEALSIYKLILSYVHNAHHYSSDARPPNPPPRAENLTSMLANPSKPAHTGVALSDCVASNQPKCSSTPQKEKRTAEEVSHQITSVIRLRESLINPVAIGFTKPR